MTKSYNCEECKDTGEILTEGVKLGRNFYSKEHKRIMTPYETDGIFIKISCYCLDDKEPE